MKKHRITQELAAIGRILDSARLLGLVRSEVRKAMKEEVMIVGGETSDNPNYDVVVVHHQGKKANKEVKRRLAKSIKDVEIAELDTIVDNVLGIRYARRGKNNAETETTT